MDESTPNIFTTTVNKQNGDNQSTNDSNKTTKENNKAANEKRKQLIRFIGLGTLAVVFVIGYHLYENLVHTPSKVNAEKLISNDIIELTQRLYEEELKYNKQIQSKYELQLQNKTNKTDIVDRAPLPLIKLHDDFYTAQPNTTIAAMKELFDNYALDVHLAENVTAEREREENDFLQAVLRTPIMLQTMRFLERKGKVQADYASQLKLLKNIWFTHYARNKKGIGSSGFEHVFLAELRGRKVLGLHNWLYFADQEMKGHADYRGYYKFIKLKGQNIHLVEFLSTFYGNTKPINSFLIGTSPELEISLYTVCFLLTVNKPCAVQLGNAKFDILTFSWRVNGTGTRLIGTAFTALESKSKRGK